MIQLTVEQRLSILEKDVHLLMQLLRVHWHVLQVPTVYPGTFASKNTSSAKFP